MESIGSRISAFREEMGLKQVDIFRATGIKQQTLSSIESGTEPKSGVVAALLAAYPKLNPDWLLTGAGSMLRDGKALTPAAKSGFAATVVPRGSLSTLYPQGVMEDMEGYQRPAVAPAPVPRTENEFIGALLSEVETLKTRLGEADKDKQQLHTIIKEQQQLLRTMQEQQTDLLKKSVGNPYYAPESYDPAPHHPVNGLVRYDAPTATEARVIALYPTWEEARLMRA